MAVISHWLPPYYLWWKLVAFFEEDQHRLCQLMVLNGFLSNPDIPGTEKLCVSVADPSWLASPKKGFGSGWMWHAWWWHSPPQKVSSLSRGGLAQCAALQCFGFLSNLKSSARLAIWYSQHLEIMKYHLFQVYLQLKMFVCIKLELLLAGSPRRCQEASSQNIDLLMWIALDTICSFQII